jgi:hypothetical protein
VLNELGFESRFRKDLSSESSRPALGLTQHTIQWVPFFSPVIKQSERDDDLSRSPSAKIKNEQRCTSTPRVCLHVVDRNTFTVCVSAIIIFVRIA